MTSIESWPLAQFPAGAQTLLRTLYGVVLALQLVHTLFVAHRFFASERHGGYMFASRWTDRFLRPGVVRVITIAWLLSAIAVAADRGALVAAALNFAFARFFFVELRWRGILRGMGAPGQMNHWLAGLILLLEISRHWDVGGILRAVVVVAYRLDFAFIMFAAGIYKATAGYLRNSGAQAGMVNPLWGWWCRPLSRLAPNHVAFRAFNVMAVVAEVVCAIAFLIPSISAYAAILFALGFLAVGALVRLTFLAEMVALSCILYFTPSDVFGAHLTGVITVPTATGAAAVLVTSLSLLVGIYAAIIPFAYAGMWYNFYARRRLPEPIQRALDWWTRACSLILWRVFTADLTNFVIEIESRNVFTGDSRPIVPSTRLGFLAQARRLHVGESITLASLFTTRRYYPANDALFTKRISVYARSLDLGPGEVAVFRFIDVNRDTQRWIFRLVSEFIVDPTAGTVREERVDPTFDVSRPAPDSPIHAAAAPGSYAPLGGKPF
jgi:hypothetical protein